METFPSIKDCKDYKSFIEALRGQCREHFNSASETPALMHITTIGTPIKDGDLVFEDKIRIWQMIISLLNAHIPVSPDFIIDHTDLIQGRDYLQEDNATDLVLVCYINDSLPISLSTPDSLKSEWQKTMDQAKKGIINLSNHPGSRLMSPLARQRTQWHKRTKQAGAKIIVNDFGGLDIETFKGEDYHITLNENASSRIPSETVKVESLYKDFQFCFQDQYAAKIVVDLNASAPLVQDLYKGLQQLKS